MRPSWRLTLTVGLVLAAFGGTTAESLADGGVTIGKPVSKPKGTAVLPVTFTQPGTAVLWDAATLRTCGGEPRIKRVQATVQQPGTLRLKVRPEAKIRPDLGRGRTVRVPVEVDFTPLNGIGTEVHIKVVALRISRKSAKTTAVRRSCGISDPVVRR